MRMASQIGVSRVPDDDDEDDDVADLFDAEFLEHIEALKQACQMMPGAEVRLKSTSTLAASKFDEEGYDEEGDADDDDDALLLSIERKLLGKGGVVSGPARKKAAAAAPAKEKSDPPRPTEKPPSLAKYSLPLQTKDVVRRSAAELSDDEDDDILRSVKECCGALDLVKASKNVKTSVSNDVDRRLSTEGRVPVFLDIDAPPENAIVLPVREHFSEAEDIPADVDAVRGLHSFLPAQLDSAEFEESPLPLAVHDPNLASQPKVQENVQAVTDALVKNRLCQQTLREVLRQVELKLHENKEMQRRAVSLVEYEKACTRKFCGFTEVANRSVELIATKPVWKKKTGEFKVKGPPDNPDVEVYRTLQSQLPAEFNVKKWTKKETQALAKGVRQQLQEIRVRAMMAGWESDEEQDFDEQMSRIGESEEELKKGLPSVDWSEVARIHVNGRSPWECKMQWENNEDPLLNNKPWTKTEDKKLLSIVHERDMADWSAIAQELGTHRTPAQCAIRYQRSLNASILRSAWTPEEDEQLQGAVEKFGEKDWQAVAACMEGRLGSQCMSRWTKVLHPDRHRRGRWLAEEDTRLKWAVAVYGPRGWKNIAAHVPGRSDVQCRERWCNVLDPSVKIDDWSPEEDVKLEQLVDKYGRHRWAAVGAELGRTDNQCFRHWKLLHPEHKLEFKKDMVIRRAALATNFVGREKERPDLGFQDFVAPPGLVQGEGRSRPLLLKSSSRPKPAKRPPRKRKTPEKPSSNDRPVESEPVDAPLVSTNGRSSSKPTKKRKVPDKSAQNEIVEVTSSNGNQQDAVNSRKQASKRVARERGVEPAPEVIDHLSSESFEASTEGGNEAFNSSRRRHVSEQPVKESKTSELLSSSMTVGRDEEDPGLIVYKRRKNRDSNSGKASVETSGNSELTTVGIATTSSDGSLTQPTLERHKRIDASQFSIQGSIGHGLVSSLLQRSATSD